MTGSGSPSRRLLLPMALLLATAGLVPQVAASAATRGARASRASTTATQQSVRTVRRQRTLSSLSEGAGTLPPGTKGPEKAPVGSDPDAGAEALRATKGAAAQVTNRSYSVRPSRRTLQRALAKSATTAGVPSVNATKVTGSKNGLRTNYEGLNLFTERYVANNGNQFSFEPPDQGLCVGNGYVLETINGVLQVFNTKGKALSGPIDSNSFYGYPAAIDRTNIVYGPELTDPSCFYDSVNQRWIHLMLTLDTDPADGGLTLRNHLDIAVSTSPSPLGGWVFYSIDATDDGKNGTPHHTGCPCIGDYPHIGADRNGVFITTNEYPWDFGEPGVFGNNFNGAQIYALPRQALASGASRVRVVQLSNNSLTIAGHRSAAFTVIPANSPDGVFAGVNGGTEYMLSSTAALEANNETGRATTIGFWRITNTSSLNQSSPALGVSRRVVDTELYGVPPVSEQKLGPTPLRDCEVVACDYSAGIPSPTEVEGPLDSSDSRMFNTWFDGNRVWGSLSTIVEVGGRIKAGSAWFAFTKSGDVAKQGYIAVDGNNVIYPGVATLANGKGVIGVNLVGTDYYPSQAYMFVDGNGPNGQLHVAAAGVGPTDGFCEYDVENCAGTDPPAKRPRWGDYPAAQASGNSIWIAHEYIAQKCTFTQYLRDFTCGGKRGAIANWSTRVSQVTP